jgi:hypothetical protein
VGGTGIKYGIRVEGNENTPKQNFMEKSKLAQHEYKEGIMKGEEKSIPYK